MKLYGFGEQIDHQVASLSRLSPPSMPNLIFGTHRAANGSFRPEYSQSPYTAEASTSIAVGRGRFRNIRKACKNGPSNGSKPDKAGFA